MENSKANLKSPLTQNKGVVTKKDINDGEGSSEPSNQDRLVKTTKTEIERKSKFPKNLPGSVKKTLRFFRVTTLGIYFFLYSLYIVFSNPIQPYIKSLDQALGIDAQLSSFVFSLPSLISLFAGFPANLVLTRFG